MSDGAITVEGLARQEQVFAQAFAEGDLEIARPLYHREVIYQSPTVRLYGWPRRIEGVDKTLEFIALTIARVRDVSYAAVEQAVLPDGRSAFVRIHFDWRHGERRLRSSYVVLYRYSHPEAPGQGDGRIVGQELYYDPSGALEELTSS